MELLDTLDRGVLIIDGEARAAYRESAAYDGRPLFVLGSIGPSNRVLSHTKADLAESTFEAVQDNFYQQIVGLIDGGADALLFETQQDILELKAAVFGGLAAMRDKGVRLPIIAQVTVDRFSKMQIFNTDIHAALVSVQGIGIDVFGINCSIGPDLMGKTVETLSRFGERLNVRGSKKVRDAVENETGIDHDILEEVAHEQIDGLGCEVIDVCMDSNQTDTIEALREVVHLQSAGLAGAMSLDSFQVDALAAAAKHYAGRPIINSISPRRSSSAPAIATASRRIGSSSM